MDSYPVDPPPSSEKDMVELKAIVAIPSSPQPPHRNGDTALLYPTANNSPAILNKTQSEGGGKHARFNIEKVDSPTTENNTAASEHHLINNASEKNVAHNQNTIHDMDTIGYATHEAVPLTMFYRNEASVPGHAKSRPTLAELHKGFDELDEIEVNNCFEQLVLFSVSL